MHHTSSALLLNALNWVESGSFLTLKTEENLINTHWQGPDNKLLVCTRLVLLLS